MLVVSRVQFANHSFRLVDWIDSYDLYGGQGIEVILITISRKLKELGFR